jgi:hypothetical protein
MMARVHDVRRRRDSGSPSLNYSLRPKEILLAGFSPQFRGDRSVHLLYLYGLPAYDDGVPCWAARAVRVFLPVSSIVSVYSIVCGIRCYAPGHTGRRRAGSRWISSDEAWARAESSREIWLNSKTITERSVPHTRIQRYCFSRHGHAWQHWRVGSSCTNSDASPGN